MSDELAFRPAVELGPMLRSRQVSAVELLDAFYARIARLEPQLGAYLELCPEPAYAAAQAADAAIARGDAVGPLHGIPISVKDLELTRGVTTTMGSAVFAGRVPDADSIVVERVKASGAVILGKTNTPEFGQSGTTENRLGEPCRNPWNMQRTAGGSSGGAGAALAAGLCTLAIGSDGGGSIRIPASFNGVFGIKPTQGRVPRYGGYGRPAANHFSQSGPMTRSVADCALLLQALAGPDARDVGSLRQPPPDFSAGLNGGVRGLRMAWSADLGYAAVAPEVAEVCRQAAMVFEELGARLDAAPPALEDPIEQFLDVFCAAAYTSYGHLLEQHRYEFSDYGLRALEHGGELSAADLSRALLRAEQVGRQLEDFFDGCDLLLTPTMAVPAFEIGQRPGVIGGREVHRDWGFLPYTYPINMSGQTAASVPAGFSADGMPIGLHLIGPRGAEARVLQACAAFEQARPWRHHRPALS